MNAIKKPFYDENRSLTCGLNRLNIKEMVGLVEIFWEEIFWFLALLNCSSAVRQSVPPVIYNWDGNPVLHDTPCTKAHLKLPCQCR